MQNTCTQCGSGFEVTNRELDCIETASPIINDKKYKFIPPSLCIGCMMQKLQSWRNERSIYSSQCKMCRKEIISQYKSDGRITDYCNSCFWSDNWSAFEYGKEFDFSRSFFDQFAELMRQVPLLALINTHAENSDYCHRIYDGRNNYYAFICLTQSENLLYTYYTITCKDSADISQCQYCELCYDLVDAERCYNCRHGNRIRNCTDSYFMQDCIGCSNCFGCKNLKQSKYCIFNEQKTHEEYKKWLEECDLDSQEFIENMKMKTAKLFSGMPNKEKEILHSESVSGSDLFHCKDTHNSYELYEAEHMVNCVQGEQSNNMTYCTGFGMDEFCFYGVTYAHSNHACLSAAIFHSSDMFYCYDCYSNSSNCFGCVGMKKAKYCILNKQYSKEEYEELVPKIIDHMKAKGEWGEFFPTKNSPFAYNETVAGEYYPMDKDEVLAKGWNWRDEDDRIPEVEKIIPAEQLPDSINDIPDDVLNWAIKCEETKRPFRIVKQELEFYRKMKLPIPHLHPDERHKRRMALRNPRKLWERKCGKCSNAIKTTYSPDRPEIVYCEDCYLSEVY